MRMVAICGILRLASAMISVRGLGLEAVGDFAAPTASLCAAHSITTCVQSNNEFAFHCVVCLMFICSAFCFLRLSAPRASVLKFRRAGHPAPQNRFGSTAQCPLANSFQNSSRCVAAKRARPAERPGTTFVRLRLKFGSVASGPTRTISGASLRSGLVGILPLN